MSARYDVRWTCVAENDLIDIVEYVAEESVANAARIFEKVRGKAALLHRFPDRGRIVPELHEQGIALYRELIVVPWRIVYRISDRTIYVLSVLDSRQNVEDILLKRLIESR